MRNAVDCSPRGFLVPDVLLWDHLLYFPELILSHDQGILSQPKDYFKLPFVLFHKSGVKRELCSFFYLAYMCRNDNRSCPSPLASKSVWRIWDKKDVFSEQKAWNLTKLYKVFSQRQKGCGKSCNSPLHTRILWKRTVVPQANVSDASFPLSVDHTFKLSSNIGF